MLRGRERSDTFVADDLAPAWADLRRSRWSLRVAWSGRWRRSGTAFHGCGGRRARAVPSMRPEACSSCATGISAGARSRRISPRPNTLAQSGSGRRGWWHRGSGRALVARIVAREHGVDLERHRSAAVTREMLAEADVVLRRRKPPRAPAPLPGGPAPRVAGRRARRRSTGRCGPAQRREHRIPRRLRPAGRAANRWSRHPLAQRTTPGECRARLLSGGCRARRPPEGLRLTPWWQTPSRSLTPTGRRFAPARRCGR